MMKLELSKKTKASSNYNIVTRRKQDISYIAKKQGLDRVQINNTQKHACVIISLSRGNKMTAKPAKAWVGREHMLLHSRGRGLTWPMANARVLRPRQGTAWAAPPPKKIIKFISSKKLPS
eukprot:TRINITY_DN18611_c0_g1_i1.p1 TRINITY_DN18611_c0_g1~~TRINITY_DN18611_c0_g1_i1.p1  ORF type:complete len:120 (-),score=7.61 TRINITY_DN18611_c0_g1_i1:6-365(-)